MVQMMIYEVSSEMMSGKGPHVAWVMQHKFCNILVSWHMTFEISIPPL